MKKPSSNHNRKCLLTDAIHSGLDCIQKVPHIAKLILLVIFMIQSMQCSARLMQDSLAYYLQKYDYQRAIDLIDRTDPAGSDSKLVHMKASALMGLNKYKEAVPYFERLVRGDSTNIRYIIELGDCYESLGNYKKTQEQFSSALVLDPDNLYLVQQLADAFFQERNYEKALAEYRTACAKDSTYYLSKQMARCYENLELVDSAVFFYHHALLLNPADYQATYRLANLYKLKEEYMPGILLTDSFLVGDSTNIEMLKLSGFLHFLDKDYIKSKAQFEKCIALVDTSEFVNKYLGYSYFKTEEYEPAKICLEKAWPRDTLNADLCYILGLSCDYSYYKKLGIEYLNKTVDLITPSPEHLSRVYQDLGKANTGYYEYDEALDAYLKAYELTPGDTLLIFQLGSHYDNWIKDKKMALVYYGKFMETRPKNRKPLPKIPTPGGNTVSYYDYVDRRINEIKEEIFWEGENTDKNFP